jgi:PAS domain S-box-containing protein
MKIATKLTLILLCVSILPLVIVVIFAFSNGRSALEQNTINRLEAVNSLKKDQFDRWISSNVSFLEHLVQMQIVKMQAEKLVTQDPTTPEFQDVYNQLLKNIILPVFDDWDGFEALSIIRVSDGLVLISNDKTLENKYRESENYFIEGQKAAYVDDAIYSLSHQEADMHIAVPIQDTFGKTISVLVGHLNFQEMTDIMLKRAAQSQSEETYLVNAFNFFVTASRFEPDSALKKVVRSQGVAACLAEENGVGFYEDYRGVQVVGVYQWMPENRMCILTEVDQAEAFASIRTFRNTAVMIGLAAIFVMTLTGIFFARTISSPVLQLVAGTEEIGRGNLGYRMDLDRGDEIGALAAAVDGMSANLQASLGEVAYSQKLILALSQAAQAAQRASTPEMIYEIVGKEIVALGYHAMLFQLSEDRTHISIPFMTFDKGMLGPVEKMVGLSTEDFQFPIMENGFYQHMLAGGEAHFTEKTHEYIAEAMPKTAKAVARPITALMKLEHSIFAPLIVSGKTIGFLNVTGSGLAENDVPAVTTLANQIGIALENARLLEELKGFNLELEGRVDQRTQELKDAQVATLNMMADLEDAWQKAEHANQSLSQEKVFSDQIINSIPGIFYVFDASGKFLRWNSNFSTVSEYSDEEIAQMHPTELFRGSDRDHIAERIGLVFETGASDAEAHFTAKSGRQIPYYFTGYRTFIDEQPILIGTGFDITERKQAELEIAQKAEELERSNLELEQFAYVASHDLQEPLRMVGSYLQLLERRYSDQLGEDAREFIEFAVDGAARMKILINDLLDLSRVGTHGNPFKLTDFSTVMDTVRSNLEIVIDESNALVTCDDLPTIIADEGQMVQLIQNLVSNAIKFQGEASPQVHVSTNRGQAEWVFSVQDNGIGIAPEYFERIFVIFQRLHAKDEFPGTGIGLAISKRIVERHGGKIWVESQPGEGTRFNFSISDPQS